MSKLGERRTDPTDADDERKDHVCFIAWTAACRRGSEAKFRHGRTRPAWSVPDTVLREQEPSRRSAHVDDGDLAAETTCSRAAAP
jgi:hypothetical protein